MKIILADDSKAFREALVMFLETELKHQVIGVYDNGLELINAKQYVNADLVLLDIEMPELNGFQTIAKINSIYNGIKAIAITSYQEKALLEQLITQGFQGCVLKNSIYEDLEKAIELVKNGGVFFPDNIMGI